MILIISNYGKYKDARNASWNILINYNINKLPVSVTDICKIENITLAKDSIVHLLNKNEFAKTMLIDDKWYIIYDDKMTNEKIRFSVAHELGHIFLGHPLSNGEYKRTFNIHKPSQETQADIFASRLLAPACILHELGIVTPKGISDVCNISLSSAEIRSKRILLLEKRNKWYIHPLEKEVHNLFKNYIQSFEK